MTATSTHRLEIDAPTWGDYLNGGYGDLVAQCSCGPHEYVSSRQEGQYWHWLHRTNARTRGGALLRLLVDNPIPEGWAEQHLSISPAAAPGNATPRYTCRTCRGDGSVPAAGGFGGRFHRYGDNTRTTCQECWGAGRTDQWCA